MYAADEVAQSPDQELEYVKWLAATIAQREGHHRSAGSGRQRAAIFGANDGLVSNLSLVMGVAGAQPEPHIILLAGLAGLLAGAFSMAAGEYISMQVQREMYERELGIESAELEEHPEEEEEELTLIYRAKGLSTEDAAKIAKQLMVNKDVALDTLAREELGLNPNELGSPWGAAISSFLTFTVGAFVPVLPYLFLQGLPALAASAFLSAAALVGVGAFTALLSSRSPLMGATRMLLIGSAAASVTFGVGRLFGVLVPG